MWRGPGITATRRTAQQRRTTLFKPTAATAARPSAVGSTQTAAMACQKGSLSPKRKWPRALLSLPLSPRSSLGRRRRTRSQSSTRRSRGAGGGAAARTVQVYFPHAEQPRHKPLLLNVRADATVEEVIGFALWSFWEERWLPKLDDGLSGESDPRWKVRLSTVGWVLRMAEDDGEVDDDCPGECSFLGIGKQLGDLLAAPG